ncbi:MAG: adenylate kinase [Erysipelotrichaceae bacterium]|nr:adenylate kinase [Erysipelotrichaceae bacterium]MBQ4252419.1 adenylate kinase [Erysipelotrichaceae bacterium]
MNKIIVIGSPGSGKSNFSRKLGEITGLPVIHLDNLWWKADRTTVSREEFDEKLAAVMHKERWIIDGDYRRTLEVRMKRCDTVIFLDYPLEVCLQGISERILAPREDLPWVEEEIDPELLQRVRDYRKERRPKVRELLAKYREKQIVILKSRQEADSWLETVRRP